MTRLRSLVHDVVMECRRDEERKHAKPNILGCALAVQSALGYVSRDAVSDIARGLGVTEAEVAGVLSFYPDLRAKPTGRHVIRVCLGESCVAQHASRLVSALQEQLRIGIGETTPNGRFTLERVYCLGNCALSPTVAVDDDICGRVAPHDLPYLLEKYR